MTPSPDNYQDLLLREETEEGFKTWVIDRARTSGWTVVHFRPGRTEHGWATPVEADGKGYPDLTLFREKTIWAELKREGRYLDRDQKLWRERIRTAGGEWHLWRPRDRDLITELLR